MLTKGVVGAVCWPEGLERRLVFAVGQRVRIASKGERSDDWVMRMDDTVGKFGRVTDVRLDAPAICFYLVDIGTAAWWYAPATLEHVA